MRSRGNLKRSRILLAALFSLLGLEVLVSVVAFGVALSSGRAYVVPSEAMENAIRPGDRLLVDRNADVQRGDVVVIDIPSWSTGSGRNAGHLERVIGIGGDRVVCCDRRGRVTVNGKPLDERYLFPGDRPSERPFDVVVPTGRLWLMGDHRSKSYDSRQHQDAWKGTAEARHMVGPVVGVISASGIRELGVPRTFIDNGLAEPHSSWSPTLVASGVAGLASALFVVTGAALVVVLVLRRRRATEPPEIPLPA